MLLANASHEMPNEALPKDNKGKNNSKQDLAGLVVCNNVPVQELSVGGEKISIEAPKDYCTYYDSGATSHVFHDEKEFIPGSLKEAETTIFHLADKSTVTSSNQGKVLLTFSNANIRLTIDFIIPQLGYNLVSVACLADHGIDSLFKQNIVELKVASTGFDIGTGMRNIESGLHSSTNIQGSNSKLLATTTSDLSQLWHRRLGHLTVRALHMHTNDIPSLEIFEETFKAYQLGKAHKLAFNGKFRRRKQIGEVIHSDIMGPLDQ